MKTSQKMGILVFVILIMLVIFGYRMQASHIDQTLISKEIIVRRASVDDKKTENAYVSIPYTRDSEQYTFVNVAIDFNLDGKFASYKIENKTQEEWVSRNMPARVLAQEGNSFGFALVDLTAEERHDFPLVALLTKNQLTAWDDSESKGSVMQKINVTTIEPDEVRPRFKPDPTGLRDGGFPHNPFVPNFARALEKSPPDRPPLDVLGERVGATEYVPLDIPITIDETEAPSLEVPTVTAPFNEFHADVPDFTQGENECVPTSTANSLRWLAQENDFEGRLPNSDFQIIEELKRDFLWTSGGVYTDQDFLPGKQAFISRYNLPLETHQIGRGAFDPNIVAFIAEELRKGQDIEIVMEYGSYDARGRYSREGGHMVTVVDAYTELGDLFLDFHDPLSPGPGRLDIYRINGTRVENYRYQGNTTTFIRKAYAESPIPPAPPDATVPLTTPPPATLFFQASPTDFSFTHQIGVTQCPTPISRIEMAANGTFSVHWEFDETTIPGWLNVSKKQGTMTDKPISVNLQFNCLLTSFVTQDLSAELVVNFKKDDGSASVQKIKINGNIKE